VISGSCRLVCYASVELLPARAALVAEILMLRKLNVLHRKAPKRVAFTNVDRLVFAGLYRLVLDAVKTRVKRPISLPAMRRSGRASARR
jgi:hypothetical protein